MPNIQFQFRRGTAAEWTVANPILADGEIGLETDSRNFKMGNGSNQWSSLEYGGMIGPTGLQGLLGPTGNTGSVGAPSTVTGPTGAASTVTGPTGSPSTVTGPTGAAGAPTEWSINPALQAVDMSSNPLINWSYIRNTAGLDICGTNIGGLTTLNGQAVSSIGGSTWSTFKASQGVDMSLNPISNATNLAVSKNLADILPHAMSNLSLWYDASDPNNDGTLPTSNSGVSAWFDRSRRGKNVFGSATYSTYGGRSSYLFNNSAMATTGVDVNVNTLTVFVAWLQTNAKSNSVIFYMTDGGNAYNSIGTSLYVDSTTTRPGGVSTIRVFPAGIGNEVVASMPAATSTDVVPFNITSYTIDTSSSVTVFVNGTQAATKTNTSARNVNINTFVFGAESFSTSNGNSIANVSEVLIFSRLMTTAERQTVEGYLAWKWNATGLLASGHPHKSVAPIAPSSIVPMGSIRSDNYYNLQIDASSNVRIMKPVEYREIISNVSATSISPRITNTATRFRITNSSFSSIALPTLTSADSGVHWTFTNDSGTTLSVTITGTTAISSPAPVYSGATYRVTWNGSAYTATQDKSAAATPGLSENFMVLSLNTNTSSLPNLFYTYDGTTWTAASQQSVWAVGPAWNGAYWLAGAWYSNAILRSSDGVNWATYTTTSNGTGMEPAWNGSFWCRGYANTGTPQISYDGYTWSNSTTTVFTSSDILLTSWGKDKFVAAGRGDTGKIGYSYDGLTWTSVSDATLFGSVGFRCIAFNGIQWIVAGRYGPYQYWTSPDGITWTGRNTFPLTGVMVDLTWNGSMWAATSDGGGATCVATSIDGITWTARTMSQTVTDGGRAITWNGSAFYVAVRHWTGSTYQVIIFSSRDGITWSNPVIVSSGSIDTWRMRARRTLPYIPTTGASAGLPSFVTTNTTSTPPTLSVAGQLYGNLPVTEVSGTSLTLASSNYNGYFYLTNSGFSAVTLPTATATSNAGAFWSLRNATSSYLSVTLTNNLSLTSPLVIPPSNAQTLVVSGVSSNTILLM